MRLRLVFGMVVLGGLGCSRDSTVPVSGKVTLDGQPLAKAFVEFQPMAQGDAASGPSSRGQTDAHGRYTLHVVGGPEAGAVPGKHRVRITAYDGKVPSATDDANPSPVPQILPEWYNTETQLDCEVSPKGTSSADFELSLNHRFARVAGRVTLDGTPLGNALVVFVPQLRSRHAEPGPQSSGKTDEDGRFTLRVDGGREIGAVVGLHQIRIMRLPDGEARPAPPVVRTFKVPLKGSEAADFALTSRRPDEDKSDRK